jgi:hypothetical protein
MDLHGLVGPVVSVVNPTIIVAAQVSVGQAATASDGGRAPAYATPGNLTGSIGGTFAASAAAGVLTVSAVLTGSLHVGDAVSGTDGSGNSLPAGTTIAWQVSGTPGGAGTYQLSPGAAASSLGSCAVTAASSVLNATAVSQGFLQAGQSLFSAGIAAGTTITGQLTGLPGAAGLYAVSNRQTAASTAMTTQMQLQAQVQPITWRDLQQLDGINLGGVKWKAYLRGEVDAIVRSEKKGGDLIVIPPPSRHAGTWLVVQVLEQFPDWCCCAIVLQDQGLANAPLQADGSSSFLPFIPTVG